VSELRIVYCTNQSGNDGVATAHSDLPVRYKAIYSKHVETDGHTDSGLTVCLSSNRAGIFLVHQVIDVVHRPALSSSAFRGRHRVRGTGQGEEGSPPSE